MRTGNGPGHPGRVSCRHLLADMRASPKRVPLIQSCRACWVSSWVRPAKFHHISNSAAVSTGQCRSARLPASETPASVAARERLAVARSSLTPPPGCRLGAAPPLTPGAPPPPGARQPTAELPRPQGDRRLTGGGPDRHPLPGSISAAAQPDHGAHRIRPGHLGDRQVDDVRAPCPRPEQGKRTQPPRGSQG